MRRHTRRLFPIPIKLLIWINGIWRSVKGNRNCLGCTQRKKSRNAITRTGIVPAAATVKMKRISRTTCGTVHDVHFARYANFFPTAIQLRHRVLPCGTNGGSRSLSLFPALQHNPFDLRRQHR